MADVDVYRFVPENLPVFVGKILPFGKISGKMGIYVKIGFSRGKSMLIWMFDHGELLTI